MQSCLKQNPPKTNTWLKFSWRVIDVEGAKLHIMILIGGHVVARGIRRIIKLVVFLLTSDLLRSSRFWSLL